MTKSVRRQILIGVVVFGALVAIGTAGFLGLLGQLAQSSVVFVLEKLVAGYFWVLERQNHFGLLATTLAIIGGSYGLYKILINWNVVRRQLFKRYLEDEEKGIRKRKTIVSRRLQIAQKQNSRFEGADVNGWIDDAIVEFDGGNLDEAKSTLMQLNQKLAHRIEFAGEQARIAKRQQAAIHLFLGSIEAAQFKSDNAVAEFQKTLNLTSGEDADALKYIAEQKIAKSERELQDGVGSVYAQEALAVAVRMKEVGEKLRDGRLQAEALLLQGRANLRIKNGRTAGKDRANDGIAEMDKVASAAVANTDGDQLRDDRLNGQLQELLGDAQVLLGGWNIAETAYTRAISHFQKFDAERKAIVERKRSIAREKKTDEALRPWPHPNGKQLEETGH